MGCTDVSYNGDNCYMKNSIKSPRQDSNVWSAVLASDDISAMTCPANNGSTFTAKSGAQFIIQCGVDYYGGDMGSTYVNNFADCLEDCDSTSGCVDVALHENYCYMKDSVTNPQQNSDVWGAILKADAQRRDNAAVQAPTRRNIPGLKRKRNNIIATSKNTPGVAPVEVSSK